MILGSGYVIQNKLLKRKYPILLESLSIRPYVFCHSKIAQFAVKVSKRIFYAT